MSKLQLLIRTKNIENIRKFLQKENINQQDDEGNTLLIHAVGDNQKDIVTFLLENRADIFIKNEKGQRAIDWAFSGKTSLDSDLKDVKIRDIPSIAELERGSISDVFNGYLQKYFIVDIEQVKTTIHYYTDYIKLLLYLLNCSENSLKEVLIYEYIHRIDRINGNTPLIYAIKYNTFNIVKLLLENGATVSNINNNGENAFTVALINKRYNL